MVAGFGAILSLPTAKHYWLYARAWLDAENNAAQ
jgi:hypothetical protein